MECLTTGVFGLLCTATGREPMPARSEDMAARRPDIRRRRCSCFEHALRGYGELKEVFSAIQRRTHVKSEECGRVCGSHRTTRVFR